MCYSSCIIDLRQASVITHIVMRAKFSFNRHTFGSNFVSDWKFIQYEIHHDAIRSIVDNEELF